MQTVVVVLVVELTLVEESVVLDDTVEPVEVVVVAVKLDTELSVAVLVVVVEVVDVVLV